MEMTLEVNGMTGKQCEQSVKGVLQKLEGVHGVEADADSGKVNITFDEAYVTKGMMKEAVSAQGFEPVG